MRVLSVVGARPQFVKLAPVAEVLRASMHDHVIVHTGQHYDTNMSDVFFADLAIPRPNVHLGVGSGSHGVQTGAMVAAMDTVLDEHRPDWVLVYGDTNSTLAGALAAVKLHIPVAHIEAGLRSFNRKMPEEHNRVLTDHASDLLLAPTRVAMDHLTNEGIGERSVLVGDVMTDVCFRMRDFLDTQSFALPAGFAAGKYVVATIHRAENTDDPGRLAAIIDNLDELPIPVLLLAHPRLVARCRKFGIDLERSRGAVRTAQPLPYPGMVAAIMNSAGVVTDSGGLQKEAFLLQRICTTLRSETEWVETLEDGWNALVPDLIGLDKHVLRPIPDAPQASPFGDGRAADHVLVALENWSD